MNGNLNATNPALMIISAMITPALLILASASLLATALVRLSRAVDRARVLMSETSELYTSQQARNKHIARYRSRAQIAIKSVLAFCIAVGVFVIDCLCIAVDRFAGGSLTWLPVGMTVIGMLAILTGAVMMVIECKYSIDQIDDEIKLSQVEPDRS